MAHMTYPGRDFDIVEGGDAHAAVTIHPERHEAADTAKVLLGLANDPREVRSTMDGTYGVAFTVPHWLADAYDEAMAIPVEDDEDDEPPSEPEPADDAPKPKRRGRPPGSRNKTTDSADQE